jgi:hypothetical protein
MLLAGLLTIGAASDASAKRASFTVSVSGTQSTVARASLTCTDTSGARGVRSGQLNERINFNTTRLGRVVFTTVGKGVGFAQSTVALASGTVDRQSSMDDRGVAPGDCNQVDPASGCASAPFAGWRLSLTGPFSIGVRAGFVPGGNPFRLCQNPFNGFPGLILTAPGRLTRKAIFGTRHRLTVGGRATKARQFADGYTLAMGSVTNGLSFTAVLTRR